MPPAPLVLITFSSPARVMLMDKCTPLAAVTAEIVVPESLPSVDPKVIDPKAIDAANMIVRTKLLFPCNGGPVKANYTMLINRAHIVSIVPVQGTP